MIADAWQIFHAPTTNKYYRMLLQIMPFTWNVSSYFQLISQTHASDLTHCRIRLLRCHCAHLGADATLLGRTTQAQGPVLERIIRVQQRRGLDLFIFLSTSFADELIDRWQLTIPLSFCLAVKRNYPGFPSLCASFGSRDEGRRWAYPHPARRLQPPAEAGGQTPNAEAACCAYTLYMRESMVSLI